MVEKTYVLCLPKIVLTKVYAQTYKTIATWLEQVLCLVGHHLFCKEL